MPAQHAVLNLPRNPLARSLLATLVLGGSLPAWALDAPLKVQVPTLAYDDRQIILVWEKPANHSEIQDYRVYANGKLLGGANANNDKVSPAKPYIDKFYEQDTRNFHHRISIHSFTAEGLTPDTEYRFTVRSVDRDGKESADSPVVVQRTTAVPALFDVRQYGAKGDGTTLDTAAIQKAIDACTVGCKVLLPAGTYKSGALYLKSNMTLEIAQGATLLGSERTEDYPRDGYIQYPYSTTVRPASLINALPRDPRKHQTFENIRIVGKGTIDGNGWKRKADETDERGQPLPFYLPSDNTRYMQDGILAKSQVERAVAEGLNVKDSYGQMRSSLITVRDVKNVFYGGFTVLNPAFHGIMNLETENVVMANTTHKTYDANNGDGIEFANSRGAMVFNNFFDTGDDCVNFASGTGAEAVKQKPQEDAWIFNNYFRKGHGMVVAGSHTGAWIQNILAEDNVSDGTDAGLRMKSTNFMGGGARNVIFRDSAIRNTVKQAFIFTLDYHDPNAKLDYQRSTIPGQFRDIRVSDVTVENARSAAIEVKGDSEHDAFHEKLVFERVRFSGPAVAKINGLKDSRFDTVTFSETGDAQPWQVSNSQGLTFRNVEPVPK
ncbi:glycoside hydrolase family 28 protein [Pseudomonas sp. 21LCFQ02]|uniref:glycosyl hydrolase family 28 protein n=1 Tax=Pseudomonas sp. 21LCFQ02 TaxID=2957505 RepID=UPI00209B3CC0|nr:glycoside hydrolase family 28 protein [Pseudomonas sp. 21LCFQ02]MCO8168496.1 glycoside hydrolase family 28 protein [Pseudomonas sp. 21LCFQ02]